MKIVREFHKKAADSLQRSNIAKEKKEKQLIYGKFGMRGFLGLLITNIKTDFVGLQNSKWRSWYENLKMGLFQKVVCIKKNVRFKELNCVPHKNFLDWRFLIGIQVDFLRGIIDSDI